MINAKTVFVLAPHADDAEFGCGGTIARLVENGADVYSVVFAKADGRKDEMLTAGTLLGIKKCFLLELPIRNLGEHRQKILDRLISLKEKLSPDLVIQPALGDIHQDHQVVAQEGLRAFKDTNLWGYEEPWNNLNLSAQLFISLADDHIEKKIKAIQCYKSQSHKPYADEDYIRSLLKIQGVRVGVKGAEVFNIIRQVIK
ncbi:MAG TPA: PIG-L family deacetylase [bacterium]|nr:PIG-L family deacetylase [bacterium]